MKARLTTILLAISLCCSADYLKVYRDTSLRSQARSGSERIYEVAKGDLLELLDNGIQFRGYYHVRFPGTTITGYIYRSQAKRIKGDLPIFYDTSEAIEVTVIDVDAGMSAVAVLPNKKLLVFDAGLYNRAYDYISARFDKNAYEIDYMILSHTDADHWGSAKELVRDYKVNNLLRTDYRASKRSKTLTEGVTEIGKKTSINDINISEVAHELSPGEEFYENNGVRLSFLMGFGDLPNGWTALSSSKKNNGVSIVVKLEYGDHSILFTGDAVGRYDGVDGCIASEAYMLSTLDAEMLDTDILVAAHHGADNGNCKDFIHAVSPQYVIFPSGGSYRHPRRTTAERFLEYGVPTKNIFRTDTYDKEWGGPEHYKQEWNVPYSSSDRDIPMDDHVRMVLPMNGNIQIGYENQ